MFTPKMTFNCVLNYIFHYVVMFVMLYVYLFGMVRDLFNLVVWHISIYSAM